MLSSGTMVAFAGVAAQYGLGGNGGQATAATLKDPHEVFVSSTGDVYIADSSNCVVRKVCH